MSSTTLGSKWLIALNGPGKVAMVLSSEWPPSNRLVVVDASGSQTLPISKPANVRWRSARELVVLQAGPGGWLDKIVRVNTSGRVIEVVTNSRFVSPEPAPDGQRLAVAHVLNDGGTTSLEIRDLNEGFRLIRAFPPEVLPTYGLSTWDPYGARLAVSIDSVEGTRVQQRIAVVSLDRDEIKRLYGGAKDRKKDPRGVMLMFWHASGIYAWSARGVLRCDPEGKGCDVVYNPGKGRHVIGGTAFGADEALLLVKDVKADPLEPRAKEIHRLNLKSGKGELWVRLPDDLFVSDIDWIDELDANDQMRTIK